MTRQEAKAVGDIYYYDSDEPYGCCKVDCDCSVCEFTYCCGEYKDMLLDNEVQDNEDG